MFHLRLKLLRNDMEISQSTLAKEMGVSQQTIAKWESGQATPNPDTVVRLANHFDVTTDYLLGKIHLRKASPDYLKKLETISPTYLDLIANLEQLDLSEQDVDFLLSVAKEYKQSKLPPDRKK